MEILLKILRSILGFVLFIAIYITVQTGGITGSPFFWITMAISGFLYLVHKLTNNIEQGRRDEEVKDLYDRISNNKDEIFILYLRPFFSTGKIKKANWYSGFFVWNYKTHVADDSNELESVLINSTKNIAPLLCIGKPGEFHGIGRLKMNGNEWKSQISDLLLRAKLIFCIPSWREGTKWEFEFLKTNNLFSKTIFIVPGNNQKTILWQFDSMEQEWFKTRQIYQKEYGIDLPNYNQDTKFFKLNAKNEIFMESVANLNIKNLSDLVKSFED